MKTTHEKSKPNTVLPKGGKLIKPLRKKIGTWVEMEFDATCRRNGLTWFRVKNGMGERGDREDWVADVPGVSISVHDYHYNGEDFGPSYGSFDNACLQESIRALHFAREELAKKRAALASLENGIKVIESHVSSKAVPTHEPHS